MKVLFFMPNLREGGAEKVLVNLANHMDKAKFDVTISTIFNEGVNIKFIQDDVNFISKLPKVFRGNKWIMKLFTPEQLYRYFVGNEKYDIVVAYLEGPATRIVAGCSNPDIKLVAWVHSQQLTMKCAADAFRSAGEVRKCYERFNRVIAVSQTVKEDLQTILAPDTLPIDVLYNTNESERILKKAEDPIPNNLFLKSQFNIVSVGRVRPVKGYDRLARIHLRLIQSGFPVHTYILGVGPQQAEIERFVEKCRIAGSFTFLGYDINPYKYVKKADLFVCSSLSEGFSTAVTESLIVGTPVCTVDVSGMREMLGENNEYGIITENNEEALYNGIRDLIEHPQLLAHYKQQAARRGKDFSTEKTVYAVEKMLTELVAEA